MPVMETAVGHQRRFKRCFFVERMTRKMTSKFEYDGQEYTVGYEGDQFVVRDESGKEIKLVNPWELNDKLADAQVGDKVIVIYYHNMTDNEYREALVGRATKTQLTVNGTRFMRKNGREFGSSDLWFDNCTITGYDKDSMIVWTAYTERGEQERKLRLRKRMLRHTIERTIYHCSTREFDQILSILEISEDES